MNPVMIIVAVILGLTLGLGQTLILKRFLSGVDQSADQQPAAQSSRLQRNIVLQYAVRLVINVVVLVGFYKLTGDAWAAAVAGLSLVAGQYGFIGWSVLRRKDDSYELYY